MVNYVILCGGSGSRLWPKSREKLPKQFLKLTNNYTMFQNTLLRIKCDIEKDNIIVICNKDHSYIVETQINEIGVSFNYKIVSEPIGRDSAPAICMSSLLGKLNDYTIIMPCDHIFNDEEFNNCCKKATEYLDESIVTFGIKPTKIETGYGYIKIDDNNNTIQFVEKPNYETAKTYFEEGTYLWNAGIFAFKNQNMILCFQKYANDIYDSCINTINNTNMQTRIINLHEQSFIKCRKISVDYAIMENLCNDKNAFVNKKTILYNSLWNDIGSYSELYNVLYEKCKVDSNSNNENDTNVINGDVISINTKNCYIDSEHCLTATIGINDLIIVNTDDSLLVCNNKNTQDVKKIVDKLKQNKREESTLHKQVFRPWGYYKNVEGNEHSGFKIKKIAVYPGKRLSLQSHNYRSEHWVIVQGNAKVQLGTETILLNKDQNVYIPIDTLHRIENIGEELLVFTETQIGNYLGEDDIIRYEDDFGRN